MAPTDIRFALTDELLRRINAARLAVDAIGTSDVEVTIPLRDPFALYRDDQVVWPEVGAGQDARADGGGGWFRPSSTWLHVTCHDIVIEVLEERLPDTLSGLVNLAETGLLQALGRTRNEVTQAMINRLQA